jgi:membrane-associated phospholipid phosphatase
MGSFALASAIAHHYHDNKAIVFLAYGLATMVGAARFTPRQHFASDIVVGGVMGWFIGRHVSERRPVGGRSVAKRTNTERGEHLCHSDFTCSDI